jgi:hypothetical protein
MPEVIVQIAPDQEAHTDAMRQAPFAVAKTLGHTLEPIHPASTDPSLSGWFRAQVDDDKAGELIKALRKEPLVTSAFVKPEAEAP